MSAEFGLASGGACTEEFFPARLCANEAVSDFGMVATGSSEATRAAVEILERGGNAIDAAVTAAFMLGVADSDASGIGGMTHIVISPANGRTVAIDGTPNTPMVLDYENFRRLKESGRIYGFETIGVPTTLASLEFARKRYGTMSLATLLAPAIETAEQGFSLSRAQIVWSRHYYEKIMDSPLYMRYLVMEDGRTIGDLGDVLCLPDLAKTMRRIASVGVADFFVGGIATQIHAHMIRGGAALRRSDLARVRVREVDPLHTTYRGFDVFTFPQPGGGAGVVAALNLLENFSSEFLAEDSAERLHVFIEAIRIAAADARDASGPQTRFGINPLSKSHARDRANLIQPGRVIPEELLVVSVPPECEPGGESTTHLAVADADGNVVSMTQTLSRSFGSKIATPGLGFPYNSFLESFNYDKPQCPGYLKPNSPIRTDMAPTIVLKDGIFVAALGTPGSDVIPGVIAQVISNLIDRGMSIGDAVTSPRVRWGGRRNPHPYIEVTGPITDEQINALAKMGYDRVAALRYPPAPDRTMLNYGGVNAVSFDPDTGRFLGVGDPRRYGSAAGPRVVAVRE
jgi:gamma-glutamyltranspeptidase/glutathione hydrolase